MNWQQILSLIIVGITSFLLVRSFVKKNLSSFGVCEDECGCSASDLMRKIPADRLKELKEQQRLRSRLKKVQS